MIEVQRTSMIDAPRAAVWHRVTSPDGINDELMPYMRMVMPRRHRGTSIADLRPGTSLGRVWILYLGVLPLDWDRLTLTEIDPEHHFQEVSSMISMRVWRHRRTLTSRDDGTTEVRDHLQFTHASTVAPTVRHRPALVHRAPVRSPPSPSGRALRGRLSRRAQSPASR